jgi:cobalamin biosynthesis protein CbiG
MEKAKIVSAALLKGGEVRLLSDYQIEGSPPRGIVYGRDCEGGDGFGILVSMRRLDGGTAMLQLIPRRVYVGIGCRRGVGEAAIAELFDNTLEKLGLDARCVAGIASIDLKQTEAGLLNFCRNRSLTCSFFDAAALGRVEGGFSASRFVLETAGVDNVCERAAVAASGGGELLAAKTVGCGVTAAAALKRMGLGF